MKFSGGKPYRRDRRFLTKPVCLFFCLFLFSGLLTTTSNSLSVAQAQKATPPPDSQAYLDNFQLHTNTPPLRNEYAIYNRLRGDGNNPNPPQSTTRAPYNVGDEDTFWVMDPERKTYYQVKARLVAVTAHVYMFLDKGYSLSEDALKRVAQQFEEKVYPTNRRYFGEEWTPGVDGDPHLIILNTPLRGVLGFFSSEDELLKTINNRSNEREIFYVGARPENTDAYLSLLAHEFQHMIHWRNQPNQDVWLNEGASVLAQTLNGYSSSGYENNYLSRPETQLNSWTCLSCGTQKHYGGGYLWLSYLQDVYGFETVRNLISNGLGLTGFNATDFALAKLNPDLDVNQVFKDWTLTNYLNRQTADPTYNYKKVTNHATTNNTITNFPSNRSGITAQYSAQYYQVQAGAGGFTLNFQGLPTVNVVNTDPHSGRFAWWSNRGENGDSLLTRDVDLTSVSKATLKFWLWYDIEAQFDYMYLQASTDGGKTWQILSSKNTFTPQSGGKVYGAGYTGHSSQNGPDTNDTEELKADWVQESIDLSQYAGKKIKIRFEYLTDEGYSRQGALLDDFEIPEIGWKDDGEGSEIGWEAAGFIRTGNRIPQQYSVRIVRQDGVCGARETNSLANNNCITELTLDENNFGKLSVPYEKALVVISPYAPKTMVTSAFTLQFLK